MVSINNQSSLYTERLHDDFLDESRFNLFSRTYLPVNALETIPISHGKIPDCLCSLEEYLDFISPDRLSLLPIESMINGFKDKCPEPEIFNIKESAKSFLLAGACLSAIGYAAYEGISWFFR